MADRDVLDVIEREIADEVRTRFPGDAVQRVRLLQYGDHPMIEPGDLWVRVLLAGDPEDYERILRAFQDAHEPAVDSFVHYLTETLVEIRIVEFMCGEDPIGREGHGPRFSRAAGARLADVAEWEHGAVTPVIAELGPPGLDTLDTLIRAGFAATRAKPSGGRWTASASDRPTSGSWTCSATPTPSRASSESSVLTGQIAIGPSRRPGGMRILGKPV